MDPARRMDRKDMVQDMVQDMAKDMARAPASLPLTASFALALAVTAGQARAQGSLEAAYTIAAARIPIGNATLSGSIGPNEYVISMSGRTSGLLRVLASG